MGPWMVGGERLERRSAENGIDVVGTLSTVVEQKARHLESIDVESVKVRIDLVVMRNRANGIEMLQESRFIPVLLLFSLLFPFVSFYLHLL